MALATTTFDWFRPAWQRRAACRGQLADAATSGVDWFPAKGESAEAAKAVCAGCPVSVECLDYAVGQGATDGVWAGTSPEERPVPRRQREVRSSPVRLPRPMKAECKHGHPYDEENLLVTRSGRLVCRACARERGRRRAASRKVA